MVTPAGKPKPWIDITTCPYDGEKPLSEGLKDLLTFTQDALRVRVNTAYMQIQVKELESLANKLGEGAQKHQEIMIKVLRIYILVVHATTG